MLRLRLLRPAAWLLALMTLGGCQGTARLDPILSDYADGRILAAADSISDGRFDAARDGRRDGVLWLLEQGKILQDAGRFQESEEALARATERMESFFESADISVTGELGQLITTPAARAYRGSGWERILAETYRALNQLALGNLEEALVHCRRAFVHQLDTVQRHEREIESARSEGSSSGIALDDVMSSPELRRELERVETRVTPAYANWANPFTTWLTGLLLWIDGDDTNAEVDMRKAAAMAPRNAFVRQMLEELEQRMVPSTPTGRVYVIFEGGLAPVREQTGIVVLTPTAGFSTLTLPTLRFQPASVGGLMLSDKQGRPLATTEELASVEAMVAADFQSRLPGIVMRELLSLVAKEVGTAQLRNQHNELGLVLGSIWKLGTAQADVRTWRTPGSEVHVAFVDRPPEGVLRVAVLDRGGGRHLETTLEIPPAPVVIVLARSPTLRGLSTHVVSLVARGPSP